MSTKNDIDDYIDKSDLWPTEITALRPLLLASGLEEDIKWNKPCYSHDGANILILQEMKDFLAAMFFKGALLADPAGLLESQGPNSRSAKRICFTSVADVKQHRPAMKALIADALRVEAAGLEVGPAPALVLVEELQNRLDGNPELEAAFNSLTPGRQREYHLLISSAKQAATRESRVDKYIDKILAGKGARDR